MRRREGNISAAKSWDSSFRVHKPKFFFSIKMAHLTTSSALPAPKSEVTRLVARMLNSLHTCPSLGFDPPKK